MIPDPVRMERFGRVMRLDNAAFSPTRHKLKLQTVEKADSCDSTQATLLMYPTFCFLSDNEHKKISRMLHWMEYTDC